MLPHVWMLQSQKRLPSQNHSLNERWLITRLGSLLQSKVGSVPASAEDVDVTTEDFDAAEREAQELVRKRKSS